MTHRDAAEALVGEIHDPAHAAIVHAILALADAVETWVPPTEEPSPPPEGQTRDTWSWNG